MKIFVPDGSVSLLFYAPECIKLRRCQPKNLSESVFTSRLTQLVRSLSRAMDSAGIRAQTGQVQRAVFNVVVFGLAGSHFDLEPIFFR